MMKEEDISDLVKRFKQMLSSGKSIYLDAEEFDNLAEYYDLIDDMETAEDVVRIGLGIHPNNQQLMLKKAKFTIYKGSYSQALEFLNNSFTGYDLDLYLLKIECQLQLDLYDEASELTNEAIEREDDDLDILYSELGFLYIENDHFEESVSFFEKSLSYNPYNEEVLTELAYAYEMKSDFASAIKINNKILDANPYSYEMWVNIGKLYSLEEEYEKAIDAFDFAATIRDCDKDILKLKAHCLSLCGRTDEAIAIFKSCIEEEPENQSPYYSLAECYFSVEQYDDMLLYLDKYEELAGASADIIAKRAIAHLQKGDKDKSLQLIEEGLLMDDTSEDINIVAGEFYFQSDNYVLAEHFFLKVYEVNNENKTILDRLSIISIAKDDITGAVKYLEALIEHTDDVQIKIRLVLIYFEVGNKHKFNELLDSLDTEELKYLVSLFFSEKHSLSMNREMLIYRLNDARECRQLFKNIMY